jgi:AmmeMemoRadiSam system protein B
MATGDAAMGDPGTPGPVRRARCAGSWYPGSADALRAAVDSYLAAGTPIDARVRAVVSPHAGLMYSGPVAGYGYSAVARQQYDGIVLVGPSHFLAFEGVALWTRGAFETPLGRLPIDATLGAELRAATPLVLDAPAVHEREHSLELQLPFLARLFPNVPILPLLVGHQRRATVEALGDALAHVARGRELLLVASSDLSHYQDRETASRLDAAVIEHVERGDPEGLQACLEVDPSHACGGGPIVAVMRAARALGATGARVLRYADSGHVTGDTGQVVGYMSAVLGDFTDDGRAARAA